jgi:hypothetical protein
MPDGFDVVTAVERGLRDRAGAWDFIREFTTYWGVAAVEQWDGQSVKDLDVAEQRLGLRLPAAVRECYALLGGRPELTSNQDRLFRPSELDFKGDALVYRWENQGVVWWGISRSDLDGRQPDPPTRVIDRASWHPWLPSFSAACVEMVLSEWMLGGDETLTDNGQLADDGPELLERRYTRLALPEYPSINLVPPGIRWFAGPGVMLREDCRTWLWVRARDEAALDGVRQALPVDWVMS